MDTRNITTIQKLCGCYRGWTTWWHGQPIKHKNTMNTGTDTGIALINAERNRQLQIEGWTAEHDADHCLGELVSAAICYALAADCLANGDTEASLKSLCERYPDSPDGLKKEILAGTFGPGVSWPWDEEWLKISDDPIRSLTKAGALIAAEIDRLQRQKSNAERTNR